MGRERDEQSVSQSASQPVTKLAAETVRTMKAIWNKLTWSGNKEIHSERGNQRRLIKIRICPCETLLSQVCFFKFTCVCTFDVNLGYNTYISFYALLSSFPSRLILSTLLFRRFSYHVTAWLSSTVTRFEGVNCVLWFHWLSFIFYFL
jgi:hypothetical protein